MLRAIPDRPGRGSVVPGRLPQSVAALRARGEAVPNEVLAHTSPLTWEHIGFSGDFLWDRAAATAGRRRPLSQGRGRIAA